MRIENATPDLIKFLSDVIMLVIYTHEDAADEMIADPSVSKDKAFHLQFEEVGAQFLHNLQLLCVEDTLAMLEATTTAATEAGVYLADDGAEILSLQKAKLAELQKQYAEFKKKQEADARFLASWAAATDAEREDYHLAVGKAEVEGISVEQFCARCLHRECIFHPRDDGQAPTR